MYKQYKDPDGSTNQHAIIRTTDNACIPFDFANTDYQEYLKWVAEGGVPLPPDSQE